MFKRGKPVSHEMIKPNNSLAVIVISTFRNIKNTLDYDRIEPFYHRLMSKMRLLEMILTLMVLTSCVGENKSNLHKSDNRKEILGRHFSNDEVLSIDIVEIDHPMLGGVIKVVRIPENKQDKFLADFDNLKKKGIYKCRATYVIRLNTKSDTLKLKVCENMVANRTKDMYYKPAHRKSIIESYLKAK